MLLLLLSAYLRNYFLCQDRHYSIANILLFPFQAQIKNTNPRYNPTKHSYELGLHQNTEVIEARDSISQDIPDLTYDYVQIVDIPQKDDKELIDVIGICSGTVNPRFTDIQKCGILTEPHSTEEWDLAGSVDQIQWTE